MLVFDAARAEAVPSVTFKCTPAPADCSGWYRSNVAIDWTVIPSDAAVVGCQDKSFTTDTTGVNEFCSADDGSATVTVQFKIKVDKTAPVVLSGAPSRGADVNGWYNHPVGIAFSGSDQTSGIDSCTSTTYSGPDSGAASLSGTCTDKAGNVSSSLGYGLKYDQTGPALFGASPERAPNAAGWFNRAVRFDLLATDAISGIADCPDVTYTGPDSATASFTGTCRDHAGNISNRTFGLKYDSTAPGGVTGQALRGPDRNGWYNRAVPIEFRGTDLLSGIAGCTSLTYDGADGPAVSVPGTCTDTAGNTSSAAFGFKYDDTNPVATLGAPARGADVNGWYNDPVGISFSGSDLMSGIDSCTSATYSGPDSATASLAGTCTDMAGNVSAPLGYGLKYDGTGPVMGNATPERAPNADGWFNRSVRFGVQGTDGVSGITDCPSVTYNGPDSGTASFTGTCRDNAGNSSSRSYGLKYDATAPEATGAAPSRPPNAFGWYREAVSVAFSGRDGTSGVQACSTRNYTGPDDSTASVSGTCTDRAGNTSAPLGLDLRYDATAPTADKADPGRPPDSNGWYNAPVAIAWTGTDQLSGVDTCTKATYGGPDGGAVSVSGTCTDRAGNVSGSLGFGLRYDVTAPRVTGDSRGRPPDVNDWYNEPVSIGFTGTDVVSGIASCTTLDYAGPDSATAAVDGTCRDRAGNESDPRRVEFKYDDTNPDVESATPDRPPDNDPWYTKPVTFSITGTDATAGVAECPPVTYAGPDGPSSAVIGQCRDNAGNVSSDAFSLMFDATAPPLTDLAATPADRSVALSWRTNEDAASVGVMRTPGVGAEKSTAVFSGPPATSFVDSQVDNGVRYEYEVSVQDAAGNLRSESVSAVPIAAVAAVETGALASPADPAGSGDDGPPPAVRRRAHLLSPAAGAVFGPGDPPLLRWTRVPGADYYNVQLFRDKRKVLTAWPTEPRYQLRRRWRYGGKLRRLAPGHYRWIVWPGFGKRPKADYGRRIGRREFEVRPRRS